MFTKRVRKLAAFIVSFAMLTGILPLNMAPKGFSIIPERAEAAETVGDFTIDGDTGYSYEGNVLTISGGGEYTIGMASPGETAISDTIRVTSGSDVTITLDSVLISNGSRSPFEINATGDVTLKLKDESSFTATGDDYAGLQKTSTDNELIITSEAGDGSTEGKLTATGGGDGAGIGGGYSGDGSDIYISPEANTAIYAKYAETGDESLYMAYKDITSSAAGTKYFQSRSGELSLTDYSGNLDAGANALIIADNGTGGTNIYIDGDANGEIDETDTLIATGNLTNADVSTTGSIVTVSGGSIGTLTGDVNNTAVNIMGAPKVTIDLSTVKGNAVNVTEALTDATGNIKLTGVTAGSTVAKVSDSAYMTINDTSAIDKAFSGEGVTFASYTSDNTVKALSGDESYTLSLRINGEVTDFNPGDEITADVVVSGGAAVGSVQFALTGDWFTLEGA